MTGANHGIGAATARRLAELGADVLITYLRNTNPASGDVPPEYTEQRAADADAVVAAVESSAAQASRPRPTCPIRPRSRRCSIRPSRRSGRVDIVVNNASGWIGDTFRVSDKDDLDRDMAPITADTFDRVMAVDGRGVGVDDRRVRPTVGCDGRRRGGGSSG